MLYFSIALQQFHPSCYLPSWNLPTAQDLLKIFVEALTTTVPGQGDPAYLQLLASLIQQGAQDWCTSSHSEGACKHGLVGDTRLLASGKTGTVLLAISKSHTGLPWNNKIQSSLLQRLCTSENPRKRPLRLSFSKKSIQEDSLFVSIDVYECLYLLV